MPYDTSLFEGLYIYTHTYVHIILRFFYHPQNRSSFKALPMVSILGTILSFFAAPKQFAFQILDTSYPTFGFPDTTTLVKPKRCTLATKAWRHGIRRYPGFPHLKFFYSNKIMAGKWWNIFTLGGIESLKSKMVTFSLPCFFIIGNQWEDLPWENLPRRLGVFLKLNDSGRVHIWNPSETLITEIPHRWVDVDSERSLAVVLLGWGRGKLRKTSIWKDLEIPFINWLRGRVLVPKSSQMSVHNWNQPTLQDPKLFIDFHPKINITFQTLHFPHFPRCTLYSTHTPKTFRFSAPQKTLKHHQLWL